MIGVLADAQYIYTLPQPTTRQYPQLSSIGELGVSRALLDQQIKNDTLQNAKDGNNGHFAREFSQIGARTRYASGNAQYIPHI